MKSIFSVLALLVVLSAPARAANLTALGMMDTSYVSGGQSLSGMYSGERDWIHGILGVHQTKTDFDFSVGGMYKFTLMGDRRMGFHVGPGATLGTAGGDFAFTIFGAAGGHFIIFERLMLSMDGGPMYVHTKVAKNFRMKPLGETLGLSIHYVF